MVTRDTYGVKYPLCFCIKLLLKKKTALTWRPTVFFFFFFLNNYLMQGYYCHFANFLSDLANTSNGVAK
jgi:hypothetical protein